MYRVAVNACRDLQRREGRRPHVPVADVTEAQLGAGVTPDTAPDEVTGRETALVVQAALARLDDLSRTLIVLCAIEGLSYPEAAEILDMPVGTIKSRVFRARAQLAEMLADDRTTGGTSAPTAPRARPASADVPPAGAPRPSGLTRPTDPADDATAAVTAASHSCTHLDPPPATTPLPEEAPPWTPANASPPT